MFNFSKLPMFETLKEDLLSSPVIMKFDFAKLDILYTDATSYALEAVLLQREVEIVSSNLYK